MSPASVPKRLDFSMMKSCSFSVVHSILHVAESLSWPTVEIIPCCKDWRAWMDRTISALLLGFF